jgi:DNA-directed RNA polymerase III subunit RPC6
MEANDIIDKIIILLKDNPEGVSINKITTEIPFKDEEIVNNLNLLIENNRISVFDNPLDGQAMFKYRSEKEVLKFRDLLKEDIAVYEIIIQSSNKGISTNEIKNKIRIDNTTYINKILNKLVKKYLIKSVKLHNTKNKKIWIGYDIEPSEEITGGLWYNENQEFNSNLVNVLTEKCYERICSQKYTSQKELLLFLKSTNLTNKQNEINEDNVQTILNILIFDNKIEPIFPESLIYNVTNKYSLLLSKNEDILNNIKYKKSNNYNANCIFDSIPCFICPVFKECESSNIVNPIECPHLKQFMEEPFNFTI